MPELLMAIDQGTTSTRTVILDRTLTVKSHGSAEFPQIFPRPGWVEHDPEAIWRSTLHSIQEALERGGVSGQQIAAIGITNQRETTVLWSRRTGAPIFNAIVWQCRRTAERCNRLRAEGYNELFRERTGLVVDAYFSGTKIEWLLDQVEGARIQAENGEIAFGTIDTYLLWRLTGGAAHATEVSNASRTLLMDLAGGGWDPELCGILRVPPEILPEIKASTAVFGHTRSVPGLPDGIPITGMAGDQQSALFGQVCFDIGEAKCTFGTGAFLLMNIGNRPLPSRNKLLTTAAWRLDGEMTYAFEGSAFIAGAAVQWLKDGLGLITSSAEIEALARSVPDSGGVVFVPALVGLGAPHWNPDARGLLWGITRGTTKGHVARATLEGIAFQNSDILGAMQQDLEEPLKSLKVDGGASNNDLLMQFQSDLLGVPLIRPKITETTALGAAMLAGIGCGMYAGIHEVRGAWQEAKRFTPGLSVEQRKEHLLRWQAGLRRV
ncbi:MAG: glycerol kinase GlpK [Bradymonadales bacterium]|nr:glycerol kinase GlpK [Bradymonadales bacterium]